MSALSIRESRLGGGAIEIGVRKGSDLLAVITHPCAGADWFVHFMGQWKAERFKTKKAALDRAKRDE